MCCNMYEYINLSHRKIKQNSLAAPTYGGVHCKNNSYKWVSNKTSICSCYRNTGIKELRARLPQGKV